jgi:hypothetical protein
MPTESTLNETLPSVASDDPSAGQNPDRTVASRQPGTDQGTSSADRSAPAPPRRMALRDSVSITLIAVLAGGGVLGAILGALNVTGWVIGVLVAGLTVVVSAILRRYSRST